MNMTEVRPRPDAPSRPAGRRWVRAVLAVVCLLIAAMWVYALFFASKKAAYRIDDPEWRARTEQICAEAEEQRLLLVDTSGGYIANPTPQQMDQRADVVDRATDLIEGALARIVAEPPSSERDRALADTYAQYVGVLIADRRDYTATLRTHVLKPYGETVVEGTPVTNIIIDFTTVNQIPSCTPPGELGGDA